MANPHKRDGYVGIANELADAFGSIRIPGEASQVLWVVIRKTYGFNKKEDWISLSQFSELTGIKKPNIVRALEKLLKMNIIIKKDNGIIQKDNKPLTYCLNKDYETWLPLSKKITLSKKIIKVIQKDNASLSKKIHTKDNTTKDNTTKDNIAAKKPAPNPDVKIISQYFGDKYQKELGIPYVSNFGKDGAIIKGLLKIYNPDQIQKLIDKLLSTDDQFINSTDRGIGILKSQVNKLAQWCREDKKLLEAIKMRKPVESEPELTPEEVEASDIARKQAVDKFRQEHPEESSRWLKKEG